LTNNVIRIIGYIMNYM